MGSTLPSPGEAPSPSPVPAPHRRDRLIIVSCIALITAVAWAYLVLLNRHASADARYDTAMAAMGMVMDRPWGLGDLVLTFVMWSVMMIGMMAPSALPALLLFAAMRTQRAAHHVAPVVPLFGFGYLLVWVTFSALATLAQWALHERALLSPAMSTSSTVLASVILIAAGLYQFTPLKNACLVRCQSPLGFLMSNWRDGSIGALTMGMRHGIFCLGCCWALMAVLFVVGIMNLAWVAALTLFILAEKTGVGRGRLSQAVGAAMLIAGVVLLAKGA